MGVADRIRLVNETIERAVDASGRSDSVKLVAVSKTVAAEKVWEAYSAGQCLFGENRVQEALPKIGELTGRMPKARWHLIGHLQTNKVGSAARAFSLIESVDSLRLASKLDAEAARNGRRLRVLIEINVAGEASKSGFGLDEFVAELGELMAFPSLALEGLMTVAPLSEDPQAVRWVFRKLRDLRDLVQQQFALPAFRELSMGMSNDFEVAIEEGATIVRLGRAIFGERPK